MEEKRLQASEKKEVQARGEMTRTLPVFVPNVDIYESEEALVLVADMPGVGNEGVDIHLEDNELTIRGKVQDEAGKGSWLYTEYRSGDFYRSFTLSNVIDQNKIQAVMREGVLTVTLPKADAAKPRQISVKAG